jgi:RNA methyltransferase, TrmH family
MPHRQSPSNNQVKKWRKLRQKKYREKTGLFLAEGERCVGQILSNGLLDVVNLILDEKFDNSGLFENGSTGYREALDVYSLQESEFNGIADTENPQGIIAVCKIPDPVPLSYFADTPGLMVATDAIRDPGNMGTIIRTAVWFGAEAVICGKGSVDPWHPKVVRSTAGATGALPLVNGDLDNIFSQMEGIGWRTLLLDTGNDAVSLQEVEKRDRTVLVVGNEANGIQPSLLNSKRSKIRIEGKPGSVESLNAAIALGIALYELVN